MLPARLILFGVVLAQLIDALTFTVGVSRFGIELESNAIATALHGVSGLDAVLAAKLGAILVAVGTLILAAHRFPRLLVWGGAAATTFGMLGFAANAWSMAVLGG